MSVRDYALALFAVLGAAGTLVAEDVVTLSPPGGGQGRLRLTGEVLDDAGGVLRLRLADGRQQSFPIDRVLDIQTTFTPRLVEGDRAAAERRFDEAARLYQAALAEERRPWVRRQLLVRLVRASTALDRWSTAGETFLSLLESDAQTRQFGAIPLAWFPRPGDAATERWARQWLDRPEPAAALIAASHLLVGPTRTEAAAKLRQLASADDRRVAALATAQLWRLETATADATRLASWQQAIDAMPESLQAGPDFVLGLALAQRKDAQAAALALLRVPIVYPEHRPLAARALVEAGKALEQLGQQADALRLYTEAARDYGEQAQTAAEARARADALTRTIPR